MIPLRRLRIALAAMLLAALSGQAGAEQLETPAGTAFPGDERNATELNISIAVFDPGVPLDPSSHRRLQVFPRIREIEALFLPFVLRETLVDTNEWGAVRVVPEPDIAAELLISGAIVRSDGETLELQLRAIDATGRVWINQTYTGVAAGSTEGREKGAGNADYQALYDEVAGDLSKVRGGLDSKALTDIVEVSLLRYADQLAPAAFGEYLNSTPDGNFRIQRLPAENDPMLERIERIRRVEYVVTDTVDEQFQKLNADIASTYDLWRSYRRQLAQYRHAEEKRLENTGLDAPRGSYEAMKKRYDNYKWARIEEQELESWAAGFNNEVGPSVADLETRVAELEALIRQQYAEWGRILAELFSLETGVTE